MNSQYVEGLGADEGSRPRAARGYALPELYKRTRFSLPRASRCAVAWSRRAPAQSRLPFPRAVAMVIAGSMIMLGRPRMALAVGLRHFCYLRPIEMMALQGRSIAMVVPEAGMCYASLRLLLHESSIGIPGKTRAYDDTVLVDLDRWIAELLKALQAASSDLGRLRDFSADEYRHLFVRVALLFDLAAEARGASEDLPTRRRTPEKVLRRGRWTDQRHLKRYGKATKLLRAVNTVSPDVLTFGLLMCNYFA
jgi:hypothetical protein